MTSPTSTLWRHHWAGACRSAPGGPAWLHYTTGICTDMQIVMTSKQRMAANSSLSSVGYATLLWLCQTVPRAPLRVYPHVHSGPEAPEAAVGRLLYTKHVILSQFRAQQLPQVGCWGWAAAAL
eukprot:365059-Chlamydomonas_euryale.AAC.4